VRKVVDAAESLRERKKARTREAILDAALDLFEAKGYDATTVDDIAAAADVSPRTFFRYFDSKLDLIMARSAHSDDKHDALGPLLLARPPGEGLLTAMRQVLRQEFDTRLQDPRIRREFHVMLTTPSLRSLAREHFHQEEAELVGPIADRIGVPRDSLAAHVVTASLAAAIWAAIDRWVADGADPDRVGDTMDATFALLADVDSAVPTASR
jgi:AcrR family transcriptional regulator